jgi:hypothetical protein
MANTLTYQAYLRGKGRSPNFRLWLAVFSGSYAQNYAEVLNFNTAGNPNGLEDFQVPDFTGPFARPMTLGSTTGGNVPELQIGGNGTAGECGINFYSGGSQLAAGTYSGAGFPATVDNQG